MLNAIKKQWRILRRDWLWNYAVTLGASLAGMIVLALIMRNDAEAENYVTLGALMGGFISCLYLVGITWTGFAAHFSAEVGFGCTRKHFFVSYYLVSVIMSFGNVPLLAGVCLLEQALYSRWYAGYGNKGEMLPWILGLGGVLSLGLPLLSILCALLIMRFGRRASWGIWLLWMVSFVAVPRMLDAAEDAPGSAYGWAGRQILRLAGLLSLPQWIGAGAAAGVICLWIAWRMTLKQQVNS